MAYADRASVQRVREVLEERGLSAEMVELEQTAWSAVEAAEALGCRVEQIVKSLVFRGSESGGSILVLASGPNRVNEEYLSALVSEPVEKADAAFVRDKTGYAIGGVPPFGHAEPHLTFVDEDLMRQEAVWAAGGHTHVVFGLRPAELLEASGGEVIPVQ